MILPVNREAIPDELRDIPQWVCWRYEERDGRATKPPIVPGTHQYASSTDPATWRTFEQATTGQNGHAGLGFVLTESTGVVGIDLDHCIDEAGNIAPYALRIIERVGSYAERSPNDGIHILVKASLAQCHKIGTLEMFDRGKYFTVTGNHIASSPTTIEQADIGWLFRLMTSGMFKPGKIENFLNGDFSGYPSQSEADLAFCSMLAACGLQGGDIDNAMRLSGLMREKWERGDYRTATISAALAGQDKTKAPLPPVNVEDAARTEKLKKLHVNPVTLIHDLETYFESRAFLPEGAALVLAYFALHTWSFQVFATVPYLSVESAVPGCGKSTLLNLLGRVCCHAQVLVDITPAALFRLVHFFQPTLMLDEAELLEKENDISRALRSIALAGYKYGATVPRCNKESREVEFFNVFGPKAFAGIGGVARIQALLDRCIVIHLDKKPAEVQLTCCRERILERDAEPLREQMEAFALQFSDKLQTSYDAEPDAGYWPELSDREAEIWGPLLIHARFFGAEHEQRLLSLTNSFAKAKREIQSDENAIAKTIALLDALRERAARAAETFSPGKEPTFYPGELVEALSENEAWACTFAALKTDDQHKRKVWSQSVGYFLRRYRLRSLKRTTHGKLYRVADAINILSVHVPKEGELNAD